MSVSVLLNILPTCQDCPQAETHGARLNPLQRANRCISSANASFNCALSIQVTIGQTVQCCRFQPNGLCLNSHISRGYTSSTISSSHTPWPCDRGRVCLATQSRLTRYRDSRAIRLYSKTRSRPASVASEVFERMIASSLLHVIFKL